MCVFKFDFNHCYEKNKSTSQLKMFTVFIVFDVTVKQKQTQYESKDTITVIKGFWV